MKGSCEIKINSISKQKIIFHKCAYNVIKLHISSRGQTRPITKKKKKNGENLRCSNKVLSMSTYLWFLCLLCHFSLLCLGCCGLSGYSGWGHLGFMKNSSGSRLEKYSIPSVNLYWVSTDVVFESTTSIARCKDQL